MNLNKETNKQRNKQFGKNTLSLKQIIKEIKENKKEIKKEIKRKNIKIETINKIAKIVKEWAIKNKCKNYSFWFSSLNNQSGEKIENFLTFNKKGKKINKFIGENLLKTETDGSSFPNGGLRDVSNARSYIVWDASFNFFIHKKILFIPGIFITPNGESLDLKSPYLKSLNFLKKQSLKLIKNFLPETKNIKILLGWEQEFFLINKTNRKDILLTGRTLIGNDLIKNQINRQHYCSPLNPKIKKYFNKIIKVAYKLGIPIKVQHSEVSPLQFEFVYHFKEQNEAINHNYLFCQIMKEYAEKYNFICLFNEKPFNNLNGSGKHCNISIETNLGLNLFKDNYLKDTKEQIISFIFIIAMISSISDYGDILMESIFSYENEKRLGSKEAPPSILSIFLGNSLTNKLFNDNFLIKKNLIKLNSLFFNLEFNSSERNRTSPFAFIENRFEFRSVGSSINSEQRPLIAFNTILGLKIKEFINIFNKNNYNSKEINFILKKYLLKNKNILFLGNNYSSDWIIESKKRNLKNFSNTFEALNVLINNKTIEIYEKTNVFNKNELLALHNILLKNYFDKLILDSKIIKIFSINLLIPKIEEFLLKNYKIFKKIFNNQLKLEKKKFIEEVELLLFLLIKEINLLNINLIEINKLELFNISLIQINQIHNILFQIRNINNKFEEILPFNIWPFETYEELLNLV